MSFERHDDAISYYSAALALDPATPQPIFIKRSKAYVAAGMWEVALNDANKVRPFIPYMLVTHGSPSGNRTQPIISMGLRDEARSST